jgi:hypothetical protein
MLLELGIDLPDVLLSEWNLGIFLSMLTPNWCGQRVGPLVTNFSPMTVKKMRTELDVIHAYNAPFYQVAQCFGNDIDIITYDPPESIPVANEFNQPTGITIAAIEHMIKVECTLIPDRTDGRIAQIIGDERLKDAIATLNDKNAFYRILKQRSPIPFPKAVIIDEMPNSLIDDLLSCHDGAIIDRFLDFLDHGAVHTDGKLERDVNYFVKVSASAGGNSIEPSITQLFDPEAEKNLRGILRNLRRRNEQGHKLRGLQLLAPVVTNPNPWVNPLSARNTEIYSPCLTLRIDRDGQWSLGQIADQILKDGMTWVGSYWERKLERECLEKIGQEALQEFVDRIIASGYYGYLGTDLILGKDGTYSLVVDPNGRMNGNDNLFFVRQALELNEKPVDSAFLTISAIGKTRGNDLGSLYNDRLGKYRFDPEKKCGIFVGPSFKAKNYLEPDSDKFVKLVYINPKQDKDRFNEFFETIVKIDEH